MSNQELIGSALKRVNAKLNVNGKLYHDNTGWCICWFAAGYLDESAMTANELLAYLHGLEDAFAFVKKGYGE